MKDLEPILSACQGIWETKVLSAGVETGLFTMISRGSSGAEKLSQESGISQEVIGLLLNALRGMGLVAGKDGSLKNSPQAEKYLVKGREGYVGDYIVLVSNDYFDMWRSFREVVVTGKPVRDDRTVRLSDPRYAERFLKAMAGVTHCHAKELAKILSVPKGKKVLDVGGGHGTYSALLAKQNPGLDVTIFDSPFSCDIVKTYLEKLGISSVKTRPGDHVMGGIPEGYDVVMLSHVLESLDPPKCEALLRKAFDSLPKGGRIVVNEFRLGKEGSGPVFTSLLALNAFMLSNGGSLYPDSLITEWLENVGFQSVKLLKTSCEFLVSLTATKA